MSVVLIIVALIGIGFQSSKIYKFVGPNYRQLVEAKVTGCAYRVGRKKLFTANYCYITEQYSATSSKIAVNYTSPSSQYMSGDIITVYRFSDGSYETNVGIARPVITIVGFVWVLMLAILISYKRSGSKPKRKTNRIAN